MRDGDILGRFELMADAVTSDVTRLQRAMALVRTRQDAFERLILGNRFGLLRMALCQMIAPSWVSRLMQRAHANEIRMFEDARKAAAITRSQVLQTPKTPLVKLNGN